MVSELELLIAAQVDQAGLPSPAREYRFHHSNGWRFDFAWPDKMLAVECEGGIWIKGRHVRGSGFIRDCTKYNTATVAGWRVLRVTMKHANTGQALEWITEALTDGS